MSIEQLLIKLKNKYNYSNNLIKLLRKAIPALLTYYGMDKKEIIFEALDNCEIHIQQEKENTEDYLNKYFNTNKSWNLLPQSGGFLAVELVLEDNIVKKKSIIYIPTEIDGTLVPFRITNNDSVTRLIHEICHAIKSYGKLTVEDGKVILKSGLAKEVTAFDPSTKTFHTEQVMYSGLEEAINSYDELEVMKIMTGLPQEGDGYMGLSAVIKVLMKHNFFAKAVKTSQFTGGDEWINYLGQKNSEFFSKTLDTWVKAVYEISSSEINSEMQNRAYQKLLMLRIKLTDFVKHHSDPQNVKEVEEANNFSELTLECFKNVIKFNPETSRFEEVNASAKKL